MSEGRSEPRPLVLDTSVAVKWYLPEKWHEEAIELLKRAEARAVDLLVPGTIQPEFFNSLWQQYRYGGLPLDRVRSSWESFAAEPIFLYATEDLMPRAAGIPLETGVIVYDALFLALAEDANTVMITADDKLLRRLEGTNLAGLALHLASVERVL